MQCPLVFPARSKPCLCHLVPRKHKLTTKMLKLRLQSGSLQISEWDILWDYGSYGQIFIKCQWPDLQSLQKYSISVKCKGFSKVSSHTKEKQQFNQSSNKIMGLALNFRTVACIHHFTSTTVTQFFHEPVSCCW